MSSAQKCVQTRVQLPRQFSRAPVRSAISFASHDDQICCLILNDADVFARKEKLRSLLRALTPRQKSCFIACYTR